MVERRAPIRMTQGEGQASRATVRPLAYPYWSLRRNGRMVAPNNSTHDRSGGHTVKKLHTTGQGTITYWEMGELFRYIHNWYVGVHLPLNS